MGDRLAIHDLGVTYGARRGDVKALEGLTLAVREREFVSVLGPSGCGKSTLLGIASGLLAPTRGTVLVDGTPVQGPRPDVGIVFQQPTLLPWKNVLENILVSIAATRRVTPADEDRARGLIRLVRLEGFERHYPHELSGGMQQRVGIARGFMHDPTLLLMDEPFAALDAMTREHMMDELQRMWMDAAKSVLFITHSIQEAVYLSDRVLVMSPRPGRVVESVVVDLPRPRTIDTLGSPVFIDICNRLRRHFQEHRA
jgi:NitT/TauT family transport system ATP-binding protein